MKNYVILWNILPSSFENQIFIKIQYRPKADLNLLINLIWNKIILLNALKLCFRAWGSAPAFPEGEAPAG